MPTDIFVELDEVRLHVRDWGGHGQPVLLLHGLASNARIWDWVAPLLARQFRVAALDQRSHGLSEAAASPDGYGFDPICADGRGVAAALGFERPVVVGHSWGANVALEYAARYPEAAAGAVLVDGGFLTLGKSMTWPEAEARLAPPRLAGTTVSAFRARLAELAGENFGDGMLDIVLANFDVRPDGTLYPRLAFESHMKIVRAMWEQDAERLYPRVRCPALFLPCIPAEPHEEMAAQFLQFKREGAALAERLMPQAQIEWLVDSIHDVPLQRPAEVAKRIARFASGNRR